MISISDELSAYSWTRATWTEDKLLAASPFRYDSHPSFMVWLRDNPATGARAGDWVDSGGTGEYARGGIVKLLAFLRNETEGEVREYLRLRYGWGGDGPVDPDELTLDLSGTLRLPQRRQTLDWRMLDGLIGPHPYLTQRGISEDVQRQMHTGYCPKSKAVVFPWIGADGTLETVKYRKVGEKTFWYAKGGRPTREIVYGMDRIYKERDGLAVLVEAEIDALYVRTAGFAAIAVGGSEFSEVKAELIRKSPLHTVVVMADHDEAGQKLKRSVIERLAPYMNVGIAGYPFRYKDPNEIGSIEKLHKYVSRARLISFTLNISEFAYNRGTSRHTPTRPSSPR
ncbi:DNA primase [Brevibacillus borstelensis AK1]|uniref:DNA primase n=1 Tax=Brevibacillus borstelensis AK1 TaxID=1300222 RepID=M8DEJ1_9BACL|nr:toprim domain-containing protein [Brevibacillus borstelensis]EMT54764.1 DNA primase [Brevibacillus borstelensis AK1]